MKQQNCICIIPSRYGSTRLKAKPLALIGSKPLVQHVWDRAREARIFSRILIATDDERIHRVVTKFGGEAVMTSPRIKSGTDRVAAVARRFTEPLVMNLQGDEPFISPRGLAALVKAMRRDRTCPMGTLARKTPWNEICANPSAVKVVTDAQSRALYFSRSPIPFDSNSGHTVGTRKHPLGPSTTHNRRGGVGPVLLQHLGVYCYRRDFLLKFSRWPQSLLEKKERLEQLRVFEYGIRPRVVVTVTPAHSIDTKEDIQRAREWLRDRGSRRDTG